MKTKNKTIICKVCKKSFVVFPSRLNTRKYCDKECAKKDNYGFKNRYKKCIICQKTFLITSQLRLQDKTCSKECWYENNKIISKKHSSEKKEQKCKKCGILYSKNKKYIGTNLCINCIYKKSSKERMGKNNPNFSSGLYVKRKRTSRQNIKHLNACAKYKRHFIKKNGYKYCEVCKVNNSFQFQVHHIYFASKFPRHKELHNFKNLILVCLDCHQKFHSGKKYEDVFIKLEKERGLKELFATKRICTL